MYLIKSPLLLKWYYPSLLWNKTRSEKTIYLTFDDGPIPDVTEFVLNTLKSFKVNATFFCIGDNIVKHPEIYERIKAEGNLVGNHTFNHLKGWKTEDTTYVENFEKCQVLTQSDLFRPPYGRIKKSQIKLLKSMIPELRIVMWDVLSGDFDVNLSPSACLRNVLKHTESGSIVVFHDSIKAFERLEYTLPKVIRHFQEKGFQFKTL